MKRVTAFIIYAVIMIRLLPLGVEVTAYNGNLALGKPVTASSKISDIAGPENINDGNLRNYWARGSTPLAGQSKGYDYVQIDLLEPYDINSVILHTRLDVNEEQYRRQVALEFSNTTTFADSYRIQVLTNDATPYGVPVEIEVNADRPYRYVRAIKTDYAMFVLSEIEVYGVRPEVKQTKKQFSDVVGTRYEQPVALLQSLDVIEGVTEYEYGVDNLMTRGEAAASIAKIFATWLENWEQEESPFTDVKPSHPLFQAINNAYATGLISGDEDGRFRPDELVTRAEFWIILLRALGYGPEIGDLSQPAMEISLIVKGLGLSLGRDNPADNIPKGEFAQVMYKALFLPMRSAVGARDEYKLYDDGMSIIQMKYKLRLYRGIVTETRSQSLHDPQKKKSPAVKINSTGYLDPKGILDDYLGKSVTYVVHDEKENEIFAVWSNPGNSEVALSDAALTTSLSDVAKGRVAAVDEAGRKTNYQLSPSYDTLYNGIAYPGMTAAELILQNGTIRLLDNDQDDIFDVVFIESFTLHHLEMVSFAEDTMVIKDFQGNQMSIKTENLKVYNDFGRLQSIASIRAENFIKLFRHPDGQVTKIILYKSSVSGNVQAYSDDSITVGENEYSFSHSYMQYPDKEFKVSDYVLLYIDQNNEVVWVQEDREKTDSDWIIGFSQKIHISGGLGKTISFRIFNQYGTFEVYEVAEIIKVDGKRYLLNELVTVIAQTPQYFKKNFLRYRLNAQKQISELDTLFKSDLEDDDSFAEGPEIVGGAYITEACGFYLYNELIAVAKNDTPSFYIPVVNNQYTDSQAYDPFYKMEKLVTLTGNKNYESASRIIKQFMPDRFGYAACYARLYNLGEIENSNIQVTDSETAPIMLVSKVSKRLKDSVEGYFIEGIDPATQRAVSIVVENDLQIVNSGWIQQDHPEWLNTKNMIDPTKFLQAPEGVRAEYIQPLSSISVGDVIRYEGTANSVFAIEKIFEYKKNAPPLLLQDVWYAANGGYPKWHFATNRFQLATVQDVTPETIVFQLNLKTEIYLKNAFSAVYVVDARRNTVQKEDVANLPIYVENGYRTLYYCYASSPRTIILYPYD